MKENEQNDQSKLNSLKKSKKERLKDQNATKTDNKLQDFNENDLNEHVRNNKGELI
ncbi:MAG: hypothetical protein ACFE78_13400 [Candidatus Hodarchaeota archaeon]